MLLVDSLSGLRVWDKGQEGEWGLSPLDFDAASRRCGKRQFLTYYFIAAHPGCTEQDMRELKRFATTRLKLNPEQVQIFTPTPLTAATAMYYTGLDPETGRPIHIARGLGEKQRQKDILTH